MRMQADTNCDFGLLNRSVIPSTSHMSAAITRARSVDNRATGDPDGSCCSFLAHALCPS